MKTISALLIMSLIMSMLFFNPYSYANEIQPRINDIICIESSVWCATSDGLYQVDFSSHMISRYTPKDFGGSYESVSRITKAPDDALWITTPENVIMHFDGNNWSIHAYDYVGLSEQIPIIKIKFHNDALWFSSNHTVYQYENSILTEYTNTIWGGSSDIPIRDFTFDRNGRVWAVGSEGLTKVDLQNGTMDWDDRFRGFGNVILIDENDVLWIGALPFPTQYEDTGGLGIIDGESVIRYTTDNSELISNGIQDIAFDSIGLLWLSSYENISSCDGSSFTVYDSGDFLALDGYNTSIAIDANDTKWIGTEDNGLLSFDGTTWTQYILDPGEIVTAVEESETPIAIELLPASPNPFNPQTTISYTLPEAADVTLSVHSVTGQQVAVLVDEYVSAGMHSDVFDGDGLASGMYFYRLESSGATKTGRMMLIR